MQEHGEASREGAGGGSRSEGGPRPGALLGLLQERPSGAGSSAGPAGLHDVAALGSKSVPLSGTWCTVVCRFVFEGCAPLRALLS